MSCSIDFHTLKEKSLHNKSDKNLLLIDFPNERETSQRAEIKIHDDILLSRNDLHFKEKTTIGFEFDEPVFHINMSLNDSSTYHYMSHTDDYKLTTSQNHTNISYMYNEKGNINLEPNSRLKTITIIAKEKFVLSNLLNKTDTNKTQCLKSRKTNIRTRACVQEIFNSPYCGNLHRIYLQSKVLEILYLEFFDIGFGKEKKKNAYGIILSNYDIEALHAAKEILLKNMKNPPSIVALSKLVHINEFKLKIGFKKLFGTTPYKILLEHRLQAAKQLLQTSDFNINQIAQSVGYRHSQNFSNAFYKRFGIRPSNVIKTKKYYW